LREIAAEDSVSHESIRTILTNHLGIKQFAGRLVPKDLNFLQKLNRMRVAEDMLERFNSDPTFMKRIVTGDETRVHETEKPRQRRSNVKVMFTVFFDYHGVMLSEFLPEGQTVNMEYYMSAMQR
jgi:hypothetical protein